VADFAFLPRSADLQYLTGVPRDMPNFGAVMHPGDWVEGLWLTATEPPVLALPRMTAEFGGLSRRRRGAPARPAGRRRSSRTGAGLA
jgi:Xaa-Pro dipeptidase